MSDITRIGRRRTAILMFLLMVVLPSAVFAVLIVRPVRNDRTRAADRNARRQREIVRRRPTSPTIQFSNSASTGAQSTLSGPAIAGFETFRGSGLRVQTAMASGIYWRF